MKLEVTFGATERSPFWCWYESVFEQGANRNMPYKVMKRHGLQKWVAAIHNTYYAKDCL